MEDQEGLDRVPETQVECDETQRLTHTTSKTQGVRSCTQDGVYDPNSDIQQTKSMPGNHQPVIPVLVRPKAVNPLVGFTTTMLN